MLHRDDHLEGLDGLLRELPVEGDALDLYEFDGFVACLLVCPDMIMPSEWLPVVWGEGSEPGFDSLDRAQATINAVMAHYNRVAKGLAGNPPEYEAILSTDPKSGETLWEPWISGFERAMRLRPDVWEATLDGDDEEVRAAVPVIFALHQIHVRTSTLDDSAVEELDEVAPDLIPGMVLALNRWAKSQAPTCGGAGLDDMIPPRPKVGRNEPCPCGSGKKFKKCCAPVTIH